MLASQSAQWPTGQSNSGYVPYNTDGTFTLGGIKSVERDRAVRLTELEQLVRMYESLKRASSPTELIQPIEDTIKRYTAELYFLDTNQ